MLTNCNEIFKLTIPAVRAAVSKDLNREYGLSQSEIAKRLGIAQAAVSKYLNNRYSARIMKVEAVIERKSLEKPITSMIAARKSSSEVSQKIDQLASSSAVVKKAMSLL